MHIFQSGVEGLRLYFFEGGERNMWTAVIVLTMDRPRMMTLVQCQFVCSFIIYGPGIAVAVWFCVGFMFGVM